MSKISSVAQFNLEKKAFNFIKTFDTNGKLLNKQNGIKYYCEYLEEKAKNPVGMGIAMRDYLKENPIENLIEFSFNLISVEKDKNIREGIQKVFEAESKYPQTQFIREELIEEGRINHGKVSPRLKGFEKFLLKLKLLFP